MPAENAPPIVSLRDVHQSFGAIQVLRGISMDVPKGAVVCIIGPSGSGKSTLLRCINGLVPIDRGSIRVGTFDVHTLHTDQQKIALRKEVSIVFQQYNLFPHKTALQNTRTKFARARSHCSRRWGFPPRRMPTRANYPADNSSGSRSRVRSRCGPKSCCSTKSPPHSIRKPSRRS